MTPLTLAIIGIAVGFIIVQFFLGNPEPKLSTKGYFTVDDGKTVFVDELGRFAPFKTPQGIAVRAFVFSCDKGKTRFVAYLLRHRRDGDPVTGTLIGTGPEYLEGQQLKRPGDPDDSWVSIENLEKTHAILSVICRDGQPAEPVHPK